MKKITYLLSFIGILFNLNSIGQITFTRTYPFSNYVEGHDVIQLNDGGYILLGDSVVRTDAQGNEIWRKKNNYLSYFIERAHDGNFLTGGNMLAKMDENWNELWSFNITGIQHVIETTDSCYVAAVGFCVEKINSAGTVIWQTPNLNNPYYSSQINKIIETPDSGYAVVGTYTDGSTQQIMVVKTDKNGTILWNKKYGCSSYSQEGMDLINTSDGNIVFTGNTGAPGWLSVYIVKINQSGTIIKSSTYEGNVFYGYSGANGIVQTSDSGYVVTGWTTYYGVGTPNKSNVLMMKVNSNLTKQWLNYWGGSDDDTGSNLRITSDGGFVICGTADMSSINSPIYLIKTNSMGQVGINDNKLDENYTIYPNPNAGSFTVEFPQNNLNGIHLKVIDMMGRVVFEKDIEHDNIPSYSFDITLSDIIDGLYTIELSSNNFCLTKKMLVVH